MRHLKKFVKPMEIKLRSKMSHWPEIPSRYVLGEVIYFCDRNSFQNMIVVNNSEINYFSGVLISRTWVVKKTRSSVVDFLAKWLLHFSKCAGESFNFLNYFFTKKAQSFWLFTKSCSSTDVHLFRYIFDVGNIRFKYSCNKITKTRIQISRQN